MKKIIKIVVLATLFLAGSGCAPHSAINGDEISAPEISTSSRWERVEVAPLMGADQRGLFRVYDEVAGVVCYLYDDYEGAAIDCLPVGETLLEGAR